MLLYSILLLVVLHLATCHITPAVLNAECKNGGVMVNNKCECTLRYEGTHCEKERCLNGGRRYSNKGQVKCHCPFGVSGDRCEKINYCEPGKGKLVNGKCECFERWTGMFCQMRTCYNGIPTGAMDGFCLCDLGYTGPFCDVAIECENGGTLSQDNECVCPSAYTGERCESCQIGFVKERSVCVPEISEASLAHTSTSNGMLSWQLLSISVAAALALVAVAVTAAMFLRRCSDKPSRVSSVQEVAERTDV